MPSTVHPAVLVFAVLTSACGDNGRDRDLDGYELDDATIAPDNDAVFQSADADAAGGDDRTKPADASRDSALADAGLVDAEQVDAGLVDAEQVDAASDDGALVDATRPDAALPPEICNGEDDDEDGDIDEGVSNLCGGCGGIPPGGCQSWRVEFIQGEDGEATLAGVVGLRGSALGQSERDIDGARCEFVRVPFTVPDAHVGAVRIETPFRTLNLEVEWDALRGRHRYADPNAPAAGHVFDHGDLIAVEAAGGRDVAAFEIQGAGAPRLDGVDETDMVAIGRLLRGERDEPVALTWIPSPMPLRGETTRLFVGGSVSIFNRNVYRAVRHYQMDALIADDGALTLDRAVFEAPVPMSSIWVHMDRSVERRLALTAHSISVEARQRVEGRIPGATGQDDPAPFDIIEPPPDVRVVDPGAQLPVRWSPLPDGTGPLVVTLLARDAAAAESRLWNCEVDDPDGGELILPGDFTEGWPRGEDDLRQVSLRWTLDAHRLPPPDQGVLEHNVTVLLLLN